jgi:hypothetical protein
MWPGSSFFGRYLFSSLAKEADNRQNKQLVKQRDSYRNVHRMVIKFRPPDIADFLDWNHGVFCVRGADQYLSGFSGVQEATA